MSAAPDCPLCRPARESVLWQDGRCRVIRVGDEEHPGFVRVIWHAHVREMTDLGAADRSHLLSVVLAAEQALRELMVPDKINLASLGNQVPHLHWHVIPRFKEDAHFPDPVWAPRRRAGEPRGVDESRLIARLRALLPG